MNEIARIVIDLRAKVAELQEQKQSIWQEILDVEDNLKFYRLERERLEASLAALEKTLERANSELETVEMSVEAEEIEDEQLNIIEERRAKNLIKRRYGSYTERIADYWQAQ